MYLGAYWSYNQHDHERCILPAPKAPKSPTLSSECSGVVGSLAEADDEQYRPATGLGTIGTDSELSTLHRTPFPLTSGLSFASL